MCDSVVWIQPDQNMVPVARYGWYCNKTSGHIKEAKVLASMSRWIPL